MNIIYRITYIPHLNTSYPKYYIGSKMNYKPGKYFGSVQSKRVFDYTNGLPLRDWWKSIDTNDFLFEILEVCEDNITSKDIVLIERNIQLKFNVAQNEEYFNQSIATEGFASVPRTESTKALQAAKLKEYYQSEEGKLKRQRISERNQKLKTGWKNPCWNDEEKSQRIRKAQSEAQKKRWEKYRQEKVT